MYKIALKLSIYNNYSKQNIMKNIVLLVLILGFQITNAQKIAYIELDKILDKIPEFQAANEAVDTQVKQWEQELDNKFDAIEMMYQEYVNNEGNLTPEVKQQKQQSIIQAEGEANAFKEEKFGMDGEINTLQEEKYKPIYDKVYLTAEEVAKENGYDYLFNKSEESNWIYTNISHDLTEKVIEKLEL